MNDLRWMMIKASVQKQLPDCLKSTVKEIESRYGVTLTQCAKGE